MWELPILLIPSTSLHYIAVLNFVLPLPSAQRGSDDSTTVVVVVVPLSIILVALLVVAVFGVAFVAVKHGGTKSSVYELNGELQEKKAHPESIIIASQKMNHRWRYMYKFSMHIFAVFTHTLTVNM